MPKQTSVLNQLTTGLMDTFLHINQEYYYHNRIQSNVKRKQIQNEVSNTAYYDYKTNECLNNRYFIQSSIGKGSFGEVVLAWDKELKKQVAIKIIRSGDMFLQQSKIEVQIYQLLQKQDDPDREYILIVPSFYSFMYNGHRCLVFEQLHYNLFDILRYNDFSGINIHHIQRLGYELLCALRYIHSDKNHIIHSDVKPENILLTRHDGCDIKLIDFGSSSYSGRSIFSYIQSRYYRAPEVILGLPYDSAIDLWSVGCVLYEMCVGVPLFRGRNELEQLTLITSALGEPPLHMLISGRKVDDFYLRTRVRGDGNSRYFLRRNPQLIPKSMYRCPDDLLSLCDVSAIEYEFYYELVQLLWRLLSWDSKSRPTAEEALQSPFFSLYGFNGKKDGSDLKSYQIFNKKDETKNQSERSCESLSVFLQMRNHPANLHPTTPIMTPLDVIKSSNMIKESSHRSRHSDISDSAVVTRRKHKRNQSTPLTLGDDNASHSPTVTPFLSPSQPRSMNDQEKRDVPSRLVLSSPTSVDSRITPLDKGLTLPYKPLTAEDYTTPPPASNLKMLTLSMIHQNRLARRSPSVRLDSHILHPPSFDIVAATSSPTIPSEAMSPCQIPFQFSLPSKSD